ncbi:MAG TPA: hypothetical protein EYG11_00410 [Candidatus Latescibacteria bacterium]|nr:hypothetical protein [Candidatus Handelsmanbacteria bacterium]HIL07136.1 hypothetical protein [Candidatus Latescibacterota bacterium]
MVQAAGIEPVQSQTQKSTQLTHNPTKTQQNQTLSQPAAGDKKQKPTVSTHAQNTFSHPESVAAAYPISDELGEVVAAWDVLPDAIKTGILAMVRSTSPGESNHG